MKTRQVNYHPAHSNYFSERYQIDDLGYHLNPEFSKLDISADLITIHIGIYLHKKIENEFKHIK